MKVVDTDKPMKTSIVPQDKFIRFYHNKAHILF